MQSRCSRPHCQQNVTLPYRKLACTSLKGSATKHALIMAQVRMVHLFQGLYGVTWTYSVDTVLSLLLMTLRDDKVSMLTHIYPHKPLRKIEVTICNHQADSPLYVWPDVVICKSTKSMVTHDTECPYWDQVPINYTTPIFFNADHHC